MKFSLFFRVLAASLFLSIFGRFENFLSFFDPFSIFGCPFLILSHITNLFRLKKEKNEV